MQPSSPGQPPHPLQSYDFILNPEKPVGKSKLPIPLPGPGSSMAQRLLFVIGGAFVLILILAVGASLLFGGSNSSTDITDLAATQTEIIRVVGLSDQAAKSPDTRAFAASTNAVVESDLAALETAAKGAGIKVNPKLLLSKKDPKVDAALQSATENGRFDEAFTEVLTTKLTAYSKEMSGIYPKIKNKKVKAALDSAYSSTTILIASQKTASQ